MIIDYNLIKNAFTSKIGWRQPINPSKTKLVDLFTSDSGLYYNDVHPVLGFNNLSALCEDDSTYTYPTYNGATEYSFGDVVVHSGTNYIYFNQTASTGNTPNSSPTFWREYEILTETLRYETESGIVKCIGDWFNRKSGLSSAKNLLANEYMIRTTGNVTDTNTNESKIRFMEITPYQSLAMKIRPYKIGLQFTQAENIEIKIFKSGQYSPIHTETFNYTNANSVQWFDLSLDLDAGFRYWVTYDEATLAGASINGVYDSGLYSDAIYAPFGTYYDAVGGYHTEGTANIWDLDKNTYELSNNYGINLKVSIECDLTQFIIDQADVFLNAIQLSVGMNVLRKLALNPEARVNRHENNIDTTWIMQELNGDPTGNSKLDRSLMGQYNSALDSIVFDRSGIDKICLPCGNKGIKYTAI